MRFLIELEIDTDREIPIISKIQLGGETSGTVFLAGRTRDQVERTVKALLAAVNKNWEQIYTEAAKL
jgi:hypothetical protein